MDFISKQSLPVNTFDTWIDRINAKYAIKKLSTRSLNFNKVNKWNH